MSRPTVTSSGEARTAISESKDTRPNIFGMLGDLVKGKKNKKAKKKAKGLDVSTVFKILKGPDMKNEGGIKKYFKMLRVVFDELFYSKKGEKEDKSSGVERDLDWYLEDQKRVEFVQEAFIFTLESVEKVVCALK